MDHDQLRVMYSGSKKASSPKPVKNPNRVLGGIRGSGSETLSILGEDGVEQRLPSMNYVRGLESKVRQQDERIRTLERQIDQLTRKLQ